MRMEGRKEGRTDRQTWKTQQSLFAILRTRLEINRKKILCHFLDIRLDALKKATYIINIIQNTV
jgi:hypothetical protein